jgi:hypothetical protein
MFGAIGFNQQDIVKDGLVLWLDANDKTSYPGEGTVWRDLSRSYNNGTLTNGPTFNSANGGSIVFDGVDDSVSFSSFSSRSQITCEAWVKVDTSNITGALVAGHIMGIEGNFRIIYNLQGWSWVCATTNNGWYSPGTPIDYNYSSSISNIWFNVVGTYNGSYNSIYVNSVLQATGSTISGNVNGGSFFISKAISNVGGQKGNGSIYRVYNRALTASEVLQNYNANKNRFGL